MPTHVQFCTFRLYSSVSRLQFTKVSKVPARLVQQAYCAQIRTQDGVDMGRKHLKVVMLRQPAAT